MSRQDTLGSHKTTIAVDDDGYMVITYHNTPVVKFNDKEVILDTGGYFTTTTKARMNQASQQFKLGYEVYQKDFKWYVDAPYILTPIRFNYDQELQNVGIIEEAGSKVVFSK